MTDTITTLAEDRDILAFVEKAAAAFAADPGLATYGEDAKRLLAMRWGLCEDGVRVVRLDPTFGARLYTHAIPRKATGNV